MDWIELMDIKLAFQTAWRKQAVRHSFIGAKTIHFVLFDS